jgi:hypothetical protein
MTLFDPPAEARPSNEPVTLKRLGWSLSRGVLLGAGLAALLFAIPWGSALFEQQHNASFLFGFLLPFVAMECWVAARAFRSNNLVSLFARLAAIGLGVASIVYFANLLLETRLMDWAQGQPEFVTLVAVCGIVGLLAVRGGFRLWADHRSRVTLWFAAALALWFSSEWAVNLGTVVDEWRDPRVNIALYTIMLTGVLVMIGVLALMDWHVRRREGDAPIEDARSEQNGLNNG